MEDYKIILLIRQSINFQNVNLNYMLSKNIFLFIKN